MKSAALLRYEIARLEKDTAGYLPVPLRAKIEASLAKKKAELPAAERRELKRLARLLTYKADIYGPNGRIYGFEAEFTVSAEGKLFHGTVELDPAQLHDGHGRLITTPED
jgi:hypothetical protein